MSEGGGKMNYPWEPERYRQDAQSPAAKLPEDDLVFFLLDTVAQFDCSLPCPLSARNPGRPALRSRHDGLPVPLRLLRLVFSSRKIAWPANLTWPSWRLWAEGLTSAPSAFSVSSISTPSPTSSCRCSAWPRGGGAGPPGLRIAVDGTPVQGNASRHKAMSYGYMTKEVGRLRAEIDGLLRQALRDVDAEDDAALGTRRGDEWPGELRRREDRLATIEAAIKKGGKREGWKRRAIKRAYRAEAERQRCADEEAPERQRTGTNPPGREPGPIVEAPADKCKTNFTDPELSIMRTANKGWEYCGNSQASVDGACQIILACDVTEQCNDKQQAEPMARMTRAQRTRRGSPPPADWPGAAVAQNPGGAGHGVLQWPGGGGDGAVRASTRTSRRSVSGTMCAPPVVGRGRPASSSTAKERMRAKLGTGGRVVGAVLARWKTIVEPVFGQIKEARGFRRFLLRGLASIRGEWRLVCLTHNLLKIWRYGRMLSVV